MPKPTPQDEFVLFVASDGLGRGDENLGRLLIDRFLHEIGGATLVPDVVIFINSGVKLAVDESPVLDHLRRLEKSGVELLACSTCLERFGLIDQLAAGAKSDMRSIVERLTRAGKVLSV